RGQGGMAKRSNASEADLHAEAGKINIRFVAHIHARTSGDTMISPGARPLSQTRDRALPVVRPRRSSSQSRRNAGIAPYPPPCGSAFWPSSSVPPSSSSSNGSHSCSGSLYGASLAGGLGGWGLGCLATSRSIGEPLADCANDRLLCAGGIVNAQLGTGVEAEIELGKVAVQMPLGAMLIDADHAALEYREEALRRVDAGLHPVFVAHPFFGVVIDGVVANEKPSDALVGGRFVGH